MYFSGWNHGQQTWPSPFLWSNEAMNYRQIGMVNTCLLQMNKVLHGTYSRNKLKLVFSGHLTNKANELEYLQESIFQFSATVWQGCINYSLTGSKKFQVNRCKCYKWNQNFVMILIMKINDGSAKRDVPLQNKWWSAR